MSLAIDPDRVTRVLIGGEWHNVGGWTSGQRVRITIEAIEEDS